MSSDDEEVQSPLLGSSRSNEPPPLVASDSGGSEDEFPVEPPRNQWRTVLNLAKGEDAIMGEDQMKHMIVKGYTKIMEDSGMLMLPGHVSAPTDLGLWKLKKEVTIDGGQTVVKHCICPLHYRFSCNAEIRVFDGPAYTKLEVKGTHNLNSHDDGTQDPICANHVNVAFHALRQSTRPCAPVGTAIKRQRRPRPHRISLREEALLSSDEEDDEDMPDLLPSDDGDVMPVSCCLFSSLLRLSCLD